MQRTRMIFEYHSSDVQLLFSGFFWNRRICLPFCSFCTWSFSLFLSFSPFPVCSSFSFIPSRYSNRSRPSSSLSSSSFSSYLQSFYPVSFCSISSFPFLLLSLFLPPSLSLFLSLPPSLLSYFPIFPSSSFLMFFNSRLRSFFFFCAKH